MDNRKYIGMDVHKEAIAIAVLNAAGKLVMESIIETKANTILEFLKGLRGGTAPYVGRRNLGQLVVRPAAATREEGRSVQPTKERAAERGE